MATTFTAHDPLRYERLMGRWSRKLAAPFLDFAGVPAQARLLDAGCGTGSLTEALHERAPGAPITGIDLAEPYLAHARARLPGAAIDFQQGDICALPFPDARFDAAYSLLVLQFVPDSTQAVAELHRVLRPGATLAAAVWDSFGGMTYMRMMFDVARTLGLGLDRSTIRPLSGPGQLQAAWQAAGFTEIATTTLTIHFHADHFDDYWSCIDGGEGPSGWFLASLDPDDRTRVRTALRLAYLDGRPDGPRWFATTAWACRGIKPG